MQVKIIYFDMYLENKGEHNIFFLENVQLFWKLGL